MFRILAIAAMFFAAMPAAALDTSAGPLTATPMVSGLDEPWALAFTPEGGVLITERGGSLRHLLPSGEVVTVRGGPRVVAQGQGGLLDVMVPRDFAATREIFLSYAKRQRGGAGTALARGVLSQDGTRLRDIRTLFEMTPGSAGGRHFGSRIVEGLDGKIYLTIGERGDRPSAQDLSRENGSVVRLNRDGSVPADNPFVNSQGAQPEIWSYGHRNPQGAALDRSGMLWINEHGARGGDEINRIRKGRNYGWPVISYGTHYSGAKIGEGTAKAGLEQPAHYWDPSIAPSGLMIYSGRMFPEWRGDFFIGSLKFDMISRVDDRTMDEVERISGPETSRVRDIREAPDGSIWFLSVGNGTAYRIAK